MFKANNRIYKKQCFSKFDHMWVRKETHKNWMDGSIIILDFIGNMGESAGPVYLYKYVGCGPRSSKPPGRLLFQ